MLGGLTFMLDDKLACGVVAGGSLHDGEPMKVGSIAFGDAGHFEPIRRRPGCRKSRT
jgi:hypothetical protein